MMVAWLVAGLAMAGNVYVNGVPVDSRYLAGITLERVTVKVDPQGNLYIDAPGYKVEVPPGAMPGGQPGMGYPAPAMGAPSGMPVGNPAFAPVGGYATPAPAMPPGGGYGAPAPNAYGSMPAPMPQPYPTGIPRAHWWLVTEDKVSMGHSIEVSVNGQVVQTVKSGEAQRIIDIGLFLRPGPNQVECKAFSAQGNNGMLYVYLGSGQDQQGTVKMDPPQVQFGVGTNTTYMSTRSYTLNVQ
jgi:hypothetical protein